MARTFRFNKEADKDAAKQFKKNVKQTRKHIKAMLKAQSDIVCESELLFEDYKY